MANKLLNSKIRAILFDLDNTLIATRKADTLACSKVSEILEKKYGVPLESAVHLCSNYLLAFRKCPEHPSSDLDQWRHHLWTEALGEQYNKYTDDIYRTWLHLRYHYLQMTPEIISLLQNLHQNYLLGLITNGPSKSQWEKVEQLNLKSFFDMILISGDLPWEKPNPKIFHEASGFLGVEPKNCLMVGDKLETDIIGGIEAELGGTVWVPLVSPTSDNYPDLSQLLIPNSCPMYVIETVTELQNILPNLNKRHRLKRRFSNAKLLSVPKRVAAPDFEDCNSNSSDGS